AEPAISFSPSERERGHTLTERFWSLTEPMRNSDGLIQASKLDMNAFGCMQDWLVSASVEADGTLRYTRVGPEVSNALGRDITGLTSLEGSKDFGAFFTALYWAAAKRREPTLSVHNSADSVFINLWKRMTVPIVSDGDQIVGFLTHQLPQSTVRADLESTEAPLLIIDRDQRVCFANRAAREAFDGGRFGPWKRDLFEYSGIDLGLQDMPAATLRLNSQFDLECRRVEGPLLEQCPITVSAISHAGRAYHVLTIREVAVA
ncbi:MAG: hypothetical protein AAFY03_03600, partial [Pseudomonadota bacterium]